MKKPNIILLTIDTLRADRLGCYGCQKPLTPNLDRLAEHGVRFTQAITGGSWTQAAFPVILTSSYAAMYGGCLGPLAEERPSPIQALSECGYVTGGFSTSPLLSWDYGYNQGFDQFTDLIPDETDPALRKMRGGQKLLRTPMTHRVAKLLGQRTRPAQLYVSAEVLTGKVQQWIEHTQSPFFVWAHYMDVHWPYHREETLTDPADIAQAWQDLSHLHDANWHGTPISDAQRDHYIELYEQAVQYTDAQVGKLLDYLEQSGKMENTVIVIVSDHGEEFLDHGRWGHWENNLYDEILHVPMIMRLPDMAEAKAVDQQVRTMDIMPTLLSLAGCPASMGVEGVDLQSLWHPDEATPDDSSGVISEMWRDTWHIVAYRTTEYKYIWDSKKPDEPELFNLQTDPAETQNIATEHSELVAQFQAEVDAHRERAASTKPENMADQPELDDRVVNRLRDLGYIE